MTLFASVFGVSLGRFADRTKHRRAVLAGCLVAFSISTALSGAAGGFWALLAARVCVGVGEAGCIPISLAMLADAYPQERRSIAMSVYYMGLPGGILLGLFLGGWLSEAVGWRASFMVCALPGLVLAGVVGTRLHEPPRGHADRSEGAAPALGGAEAGQLAFLPGLLVLLRCRTFVCVLLGGALNLFAAIGLFTWMPSFCERRFGTSTGDTGTALSGAMVFGAFCTLAGGAACDALFRRGAELGVYAKLPAASVLLGFPFACALCVAPSFASTVLFFLPPTLSANVPSGPLRCLISALVPANRRTVANSVLEIGIGLAGGLGPLFVGGLSDTLQRSRCPGALASLKARQALTEDERRCSAGALSSALLAIQFASLPAAALLLAASYFAEGDLARASTAAGAVELTALPSSVAEEGEVVERAPDAAVSAEAARVQAEIMAKFAARKAAREAAGAAGSTPGRAHRVAALAVVASS